MEETAPNRWTPPVPPRGPCRTCGANLVDWNRVTKRNLSDAANTFEEMRKERIRHYFWHAEFDEAAVRHALRKGRRGLEERAEQEIRRGVGMDTVFDGRQTPFWGNVIHCSARNGDMLPQVHRGVARHPASTTA